MLDLKGSNSKAKRRRQRLREEPERRYVSFGHFPEFSNFFHGISPSLTVGVETLLGLRIA